MAANLFGKRFYGLRTAAWHGEGFVSQVGELALPVFDQHMAYDVILAPQLINVGDRLLASPKRAIVRTPTPDSPEYLTWGAGVEPDYELVPPREVAQVLDTSIGRPVETMGSLADGMHFFTTYTMPGHDIMGDELKNYLIVHAPYNGKAAIKVRVSTVRVVCQNTLDASERHASEKFSIRHDGNAYTRLAKWTDGVWERAIEKLDGVVQLYERMAKTPLTAERVDGLIEQLFPLGKGATVVPDDEVTASREKYAAARRAMTLKERTICHELFDGAGLGSDSPAARGTVWGLWNAFCEVQDWTGDGRPNTDPADTGSIADRLFGQALAVKDRAFDLLVQVR